jgi:hypothetical protein
VVDTSGEHEACSNAGAMKGVTPPREMMTSLRSLLSSSPLRIASCKWRRTILQRNENRISTVGTTHRPAPEQIITSAFYYHSRRSQRALEYQRRDIPAPRRRRAWRIGHSSGGDADARRTRGLPGRNATELWTCRHGRCRPTCRTFLLSFSGLHMENDQ